MAKALVIKNADFSTNKVTTVTFSDISCTGVAFESDTVTVSGLGTAAIQYTLTPSNTTDTVSLTSSDSTVLSVSGTTITAVGIGTCVLTLSCGTHSATCTATVDIYEDPVWSIAFATVISKDTSGEEYDCCRLRGTSRTYVAATGDFADGNFTYPINYEQSSEGFNPGSITAFKIPANTTKIHIETGKLLSSGSKVYFVNSNEQYVYNGANFTPILSKVELSVTAQGGGSYQTNDDVTVPEGCDGFFVAYRVYPDIVSSITDEAALKEYAEETMGAVIHYLAT